MYLKSLMGFYQLKKFILDKTTYYTDSQPVMLIRDKDNVIFIKNYTRGIFTEDIRATFTEDSIKISYTYRGHQERAFVYKIYELNIQKNPQEDCIATGSCSDPRTDKITQLTEDEIEFVANNILNNLKKLRFQLLKPLPPKPSTSTDNLLKAWEANNVFNNNKRLLKQTEETEIPAAKISCVG